MNNPNVLIAMAHVSENANNPYSVFCEYIKYCIFAHRKNEITITEIIECVDKEFGLVLPYNVMIKCLSIIEEQKTIKIFNHRVKLSGDFDTESFEARRLEYKEIESNLIRGLIGFVSKYGKSWDEKYAREQLVKVLDRDCIAYDIFMRRDPAIENDNVCNEYQSGEGEEIFSDELFVGKFIAEALETDSIYKQYLLKICEGLMVCIGAYQVPSFGQAGVTFPHVRGTAFYFDTRLLLRLIGCAGEAAVSATRELVKLIQDNGGHICYYPHTLEEMNIALSEAHNCLRKGLLPTDHEMRAYTIKIGKRGQVLAAKKANLQNELAKANIYLRELEDYSDIDRLKYGFDCEDFISYMKSSLGWDDRTIENDALSIWETHMRRRGNYTEYCGTNQQLGIFVTSNTRLLNITLGYKDVREGLKCVAQWKSNRLPIITDIRLTCRLWSPSVQGEQLSMLYLAANAVAAQRPTRKYFERVRDLAEVLEKEIPEYSGLHLGEYFDDQMTDILLKNTQGDGDKLDAGLLASSVAELAEWKAKEQEEITKLVERERDIAREERDLARNARAAQTEELIEDAAKQYASNFGWRNIVIYLCLNWGTVVSIIFVALFAVVSMTMNQWCWILCVAVPILLAIIEKVTASNFVVKRIVRLVVPKMERSFKAKIRELLRKTEKTYEEEIIERSIEKVEVLTLCKRIMG